MTISLDAMGGDKAPEVVIQGVQIARTRLPHVQFLLFGDQAKLEPLLDRMPDLRTCCQVRH
ncbi:MAG TPA: phosphate acyltransferase, partial [Patescibacteria group bacterium]|nr:phosphate acyltransferase [Patescibacteria group bacterium]